MTITERAEPATTADERTSLEGWLEYHRATLALKCEGLTDEQLRVRAVPSSELTLLGLTRHMAEVERFWFQEITLGREVPDLFCTREDMDGDFHVTEADGYAEAEAARQEAMALAREIGAARPLDSVSEGRHPRSGEGFDLRWVYTHMIEEYARHNGHADLLRELIDGVTGE
ncbi:DinB family protein [Streptomyces sp. NPDC101118]|uniref:DinB family protein n=1 Tax=Streptomyces sp. NPDC101118 TaxID=3366109 RepID=UPI0038192F0F